jgi:hypothetical protein
LGGVGKQTGRVSRVLEINYGFGKCLNIKAGKFELEKNSLREPFWDGI